MKVGEIISRLKGARRSGDGWVARCPAHQDRSPSLSIRQNKEKILLHCFGGCAPEAVCASLGIEMRELFAEPWASHKSEPRIVRNVQQQISGLRSRLTPREREREITVVIASRDNPDPAMRRALELAVEGELVQVALKKGS